MRVGLEASCGSADGVQRGLAVVAERRVPDVVGQTGEIDQIGVTTELFTDLAGDLRDLQRMGQPGPGHGVLVGGNYLSLAGQPAERAGVQHPGAVPGEGAAAAGADRLREPGRLLRLDDESLEVEQVVGGGGAGMDHRYITVVPAPEEPPVSR